MARSYKRHLFVSTGTYNGSKRRANKKVRQKLKDFNNMFNNSSYKKVYCSWDIKDYTELAPSFELFYKIMMRRWDLGMRRWCRTWQNTSIPPDRKYCKSIYDRWYRRK